MDVNNVTFGKPGARGAIFTAPLGTALPTDATTSLNEAFKDLGFVSDDGLKNANNSSSEKKTAWGGQTVLVGQKEKDDTFTYKLIEVLNVDVLAEVYGKDNVNGTLKDGITVRANSKPGTPHSIVIEMLLKNAVKRIVIPNAVLSELSDIEYKDDDAVGYEITINALPDDKGNTHYEYLKGV